MPWVFGALVLAVFLPEHVKLWHVFPVWYHLTFLVTLVPLIVLGARLTQQRASRGEAGPATSISTR
jgi:hypothetical protein